MEVSSLSREENEDEGEQQQQQQQWSAASTAGSSDNNKGSSAGGGGGGVERCVSFSSTSASEEATSHHASICNNNSNTSSVHNTKLVIDPNTMRPASWRNTQSFHSVNGSAAAASSAEGGAAGAAGTGTGTYAAQAKLPRLPIPTLGETMGKFPHVVAAILSSESEMQETQRLCQDFMENDGPVLQEALIEYEKQGVEAGLLGSYVEEFWNESYLAVDGSVVLNLNPFFVLESGKSVAVYTNKSSVYPFSCMCMCILMSQVLGLYSTTHTMIVLPCCYFFSLVYSFSDAATTTYHHCCL
jgi:Choline/Carnitine o-acyltransferase